VTDIQPSHLIEPLELAYLAGFMDADGHFGITTRKVNGAIYYRSIVQVAQTKLGIMEHLVELVGAGYLQKNTKKRIWNLRFNASTCRWLLPQLIPYLVLKKRQAQIALDLLNRAHIGKNGKRTTFEELRKRESLRRESKSLNARQSGELYH